MTYYFWLRTSSTRQTIFSCPERVQKTTRTLKLCYKEFVNKITKIGCYATQRSLSARGYTPLSYRNKVFMNKTHKPAELCYLTFSKRDHTPLNWWCWCSARTLHFKPCQREAKRSRRNCWRCRLTQPWRQAAIEPRPAIVGIFSRHRGHFSAEIVKQLGRGRGFHHALPFAALTNVTHHGD